MRDYWPFIQPLIKQYWRMALLGLLLNLVTSLSGMTLLAVAGWFISATGLAGVVGMTLNTGLPSASIRALALVRILSRYYDLLISHQVIFCLLADLRTWVYQKCLPLAPFHLALFRSSDLLNRMITDINALDGFYLRVILPFVTSICVALLSTAVLFHISIKLTLFFAVACFLSFILIPLMAYSFNLSIGQRLVESQAKLREIFVTGTQSLATLLSFDRITHFKLTLKEKNTDLSRAQTQLNHLEGFSLAVFQSISGGLIVLTLWLGPNLTEQLQSGPLFALLTLGMIGVSSILMELPLGLQSLGKIRFSAARIISISHTKPPIVFPENPAPLPPCLDLHFNNISFSYPNSKLSVINNFNATIRLGEHVLITGPTGIGKSSLAYLCLRFLDPTQGQIFLGHTPIQSLSEQDLRHTISMVSQEPHLFQNSIRHNLHLGRPKASDQEYWQALEWVGLKQDVLALPRQLDTWIGEHGVQLSGGQQKRLAIAIGLLYHPAILILDEPTEGLDSLTAQQMILNIRKLYQGQTLCIISHQAQDLKHCDRAIKIT